MNSSTFTAFLWGRWYYFHFKGRKNGTQNLSNLPTDCTITKQQNQDSITGSLTPELIPLITMQYVVYLKRRFIEEAHLCAAHRRYPIVQTFRSLRWCRTVCSPDCKNYTFLLTLIAVTFYCQSHDGSLYSQQHLHTASTHALSSEFQL